MTSKLTDTLKVRQLALPHKAELSHDQTQRGIGNPKSNDIASQAPGLTFFQGPIFHSKLTASCCRLPLCVV